jgi:hypothetical protein
MSEGLLATTIAARLSAADSRVAVMASDGAEVEPAPDGPWLSVRVELGTAVIGPLTVPGVAGCATCVRTRRNFTPYGIGLPTVFGRPIRA